MLKEEKQKSIEWEKISHFQLIENLLGTDKFKKNTLNSLSKVIDKFTEKEIEKIIYEVDEAIESSWLDRHLPEERKELIWELLALRHRKLRDIYLKHQ